MSTKNTLSKAILDEFSDTKIFVETGTSNGDGLQEAINHGYDELHSIEHDKQLFYNASIRFLKNDKVVLHQGDSTMHLWGILHNISQPITFWLDAHDEKTTSVMEELGAIQNHFVTNHTILIDDIRYFRNNYWKIGLSELKGKILKINPSYKIQYVDSLLFEKDILVASL